MSMAVLWKCFVVIIASNRVRRLQAGRKKRYWRNARLLFERLWLLRNPDGAGYALPNRVERVLPRSQTTATDGGRYGSAGSERSCIRAAADRGSPSSVAMDAHSGSSGNVGSFAKLGRGVWRRLVTLWLEVRGVQLEVIPDGLSKRLVGRDEVRLAEGVEPRRERSRQDG